MTLDELIKARRSVRAALTSTRTALIGASGETRRSILETCTRLTRAEDALTECICSARAVAS